MILDRYLFAIQILFMGTTRDMGSVSKGESIQASGGAGNAVRLAMVAVAGVSAFLNLYAAQPLLPTLAKVFGVDPGRTSLLVSAPTLAVALSAPFLGMVSDRYGRRRTLVVSLFGLALPTLLAATAGTFAQLVFWRFLTGIFLPGIITSAIAYIAEEWGEDAPRAVSLYVTATVLGGFLGRMLAGFFGEHGGWKLSFLVLGSVTLAGAVAVQGWLPKARTRQATSGAVNWGGEIVHHLRNPDLLATYALGFGVLFSLVAVFTFLVFHLAAPPYRLGPTSQGMIFLVYLLGLVVTPTSGDWIRRFGASRTVLAALAASCLGVGLTLVTPLALVIAGLALCTTGVFVCQAAASSYIGQAADRTRSVAAGLYVSCYYAGGSAGAVGSGLAWHRAGWTGCVALVVLVQLACAVLVHFAWGHPAAQPKEELVPAVP
jgi:predicted MFS family arabinose efflux permease